MAARFALFFCCEFTQLPSCLPALLVGVGGRGGRTCRQIRYMTAKVVSMISNPRLLQLPQNTTQLQSQKGGHSNSDACSIYPVEPVVSPLRNELVICSQAREDRANSATPHCEQASQHRVGWKLDAATEPINAGRCVLSITEALC